MGLHQRNATVEQVARIMQLRERDDLTYAQIARRVPFTERTVSRIIKRELEKQAQTT